MTNSTASPVINGEVMNAEVLPPDVDTKVMALKSIDSPELQARAVTTMLSHSRTGLLAAIAAQDLPEIAEFKRKAAAIAEIAKQVRLGKDMQLDAAEFCRRAERGLGVAIRDGQDRGDVLARGQTKSRANQYGSAPLEEGKKSSPTDFASVAELKSGQSIYEMTDGVSDAQFEESITEAKAEGNLSRANVARKCKAKANPAPLIDENDPEIDAEIQPKPTDMPTRNKPEPGPRPFKKSDTEMLAEIAGSLANFADLIGYIHPEQIESDDAKRLSIQAFHALSRIRKAFKEINNGKA